jgi:O-Antigen ligase
MPGAMLNERFVDGGRVAAVITLALGAGLLVVETGYAAIAGGAVVVALAIIIAWPRQNRASSAAGAREVILTTILLLYVVPLLMLGRVFALVGSSPIYLPDVLLVLAALLMLPKVKLGLIRPVPLLCTAIAVLALHAVYVGYEHGYPAATKGLVLALYPLLAIAIAGWIGGLDRPDHVLSVLAQYVLPLITVGLAVVILSNASFIAASYGLYLAIAGAFAVTRGMPYRRMLGLSTCVGLILLVSINAERGPTLTVLLAALSAWLAGSRFRSRATNIGRTLAAAAVVTGVAFTFSLGIVHATQIPVVGRLATRVTATNTSEGVSAANNVTLRRAIWSYALHTTYAQNPLLGVGAYHPIEVTYFGNDLQRNADTGVHNSFVGYIFYAGFPAGVLVVLVFAIGLWRVWRVRHRTIYAPALFGSLVAVVVTSLTNVALETTYIGGPSWCVLAIAVGVAGNRSEVESNDPTKRGSAL